MEGMGKEGNEGLAHRTARVSRINHLSLLPTLKLHSPPVHNLTDDEHARARPPRLPVPSPSHLDVALHIWGIRVTLLCATKVLWEEVLYWEPLSEEVELVRQAAVLLCEAPSAGTTGAARPRRRRGPAPLLRGALAAQGWSPQDLRARGRQAARNFLGRRRASSPGKRPRPCRSWRS